MCCPPKGQQGQAWNPMDGGAGLKVLKLVFQIKRIAESFYSFVSNFIMVIGSFIFNQLDKVGAIHAVLFGKTSKNNVIIIGV